MAPQKWTLTIDETEAIEKINEGGTEEVIKLVNKPGFRVKCLDDNGMSLLQHAAYKGNTRLCEFFLRKGVDVNSNYHEHGYTTLMFAALSGKTDTTQVILQAGGSVTATNSVGRTAAQMAAFVGQHQCVTLINNFFSKTDLEYYTVARDLEVEPKLPPHLCDPLYEIILNSNLNPVKISMMLQDSLQILDESYKVAKLLEFLCEKMMKRSDTNEVMAMKFHYLSYLIRMAEKSRQTEKDKLDAWIKRLLIGDEPMGNFGQQEKLIRAMLKEHPYVESALLQQIVRSLATKDLGGDASALTMLNQGINGQRMSSPDDNPCTTCADFGADKKCSKCKMVNYCNQTCQKRHWFSHKKFCAKLNAMRIDQEEQMRQAEAERLKMEEEKKKQEEEQRLKAEAEQTEKEEKKDQEEEEENVKEGMKDLNLEDKCDGDRPASATDIHIENINSTKQEQTSENTEKTD